MHLSYLGGVCKQAKDTYLHWKIMKKCFRLPRKRGKKRRQSLSESQKLRQILVALLNFYQYFYIALLEMGCFHWFGLLLLFLTIGHLNSSYKSWCLALSTDHLMLAACF